MMMSTTPTSTPLEQSSMPPPTPIRGEFAEVWLVLRRRDIRIRGSSRDRTVHTHRILSCLLRLCCCRSHCLPRSLLCGRRNQKSRRRLGRQDDVRNESRLAVREGFAGRCASAAIRPGRAWVAVEEGYAEFSGWDCWRLGVCWDGIADQRVEGGHERVAEDRACGASRHVEGGWCRVYQRPGSRV